jgi:hypothetical protein
MLRNLKITIGGSEERWSGDGVDFIGYAEQKIL